MRIPHSRKSYIFLMMFQALMIVVIEIASIVISWNYWSIVPFVCGIVCCLGLAFVLAQYYYTGAIFKCPECEKIFKPKRKDFMKNVNVKHGRMFNCPSCMKKVKCKEGFIYGNNFKEA